MENIVDNTTSLLVTEKIVILFMILLVGVYARKMKILDGSGTKTLSKLLLGVTSPLLIIHSFQIVFTKEKFETGLKVLLLSVVIHTITSIIGKLLYRKAKRASRSVYELALIFANCAFLGYPVLDIIMEDGIFYGAFYTLYFNVYIWTYGVYVINKYADENKAELKLSKIFVNPGTIACLAGILLFVFQVKLPGVIASSVEMGANMTFPLSMLIIGSLIATMDLKKIFTNISVYIYCFIKLIIMPLTAIGVCYLFKFGPALANMCVVMSAVPTATMVASFAEMYDADSGLAAECVGMSTLLSVATIPLVIYIKQFVLGV